MVCEKKIVSLKERESLTILFFGLEVVDFIRRLIYSELILTRDNFCQVVTDKKLQDLESCHNLIVTHTAANHITASVTLPNHTSGNIYYSDVRY